MLGNFEFILNFLYCAIQFFKLVVHVYKFSNTSGKHHAKIINELLSEEVNTFNTPPL